MNLFWMYAFNILINSALAFATIALLVKFLLWAFRIQRPRMVALCLSLPLFKVAFDFFLYNSSRWALSSEINPLRCAPGTRAITATLTYPFNSGIYFSVEGGKTFTVADLIALSVDPLWIKITVLLVFSVSILRLLQALRARKGVKELLTKVSPCLRPVSALIQKALKTTKIFTSTEVEVPCAFHRTIIFPEKLIKELSQSEFEAIVVHELDHLRWKDSALRSAQHMLATFFWWIPTKKWQSRLALCQELACDAKISKFNLLPIDLASAIAKAARGAQKSSRKNSTCLPLMFFVEKGQLLSRVKALVNPAKQRAFGVRMLQAFFAFSLLTVLFFGQFWIF